jgi:nucleoid-associated protein YgaU
MTDRSSRHADLPTYRREVAGTDDVELFQPRLRPAPAGGGTPHTVTGAERLDLLADRYLGDPHQYWRIADANPEVELEALLSPGRTVTIPERPA